MAKINRKMANFRVLELLGVSEGSDSKIFVTKKFHLNELQLFCSKNFFVRPLGWAPKWKNGFFENERSVKKILASAILKIFKNPRVQLCEIYICTNARGVFWKFKKLRTLEFFLQTAEFCPQFLTFWKNLFLKMTFWPLIFPNSIFFERLLLVFIAKKLVPLFKRY